MAIVNNQTYQICEGINNRKVKNLDYTIMCSPSHVKIPNSSKVRLSTLRGIRRVIDRLNEDNAGGFNTTHLDIEYTGLNCYMYQNWDIVSVKDYTIVLKLINQSENITSTSMPMFWYRIAYGEKKYQYGHRWGSLAPGDRIKFSFPSILKTEFAVIRKIYGKENASPYQYPNNYIVVELDRKINNIFTTFSEKAECYTKQLPNGFISGSYRNCYFAHTKLIKQQTVADTCGLIWDFETGTYETIYTSGYLPFTCTTMREIKTPDRPEIPCGTTRLKCKFNKCDYSNSIGTMIQDGYGSRKYKANHFYYCTQYKNLLPIHDRPTFLSLALSKPNVTITNTSEMQVVKVVIENNTSKTIELDGNLSARVGATGQEITVCPYIGDLLDNTLITIMMVDANGKYELYFYSLRTQDACWYCSKRVFTVEEFYQEGLSAIPTNYKLLQTDPQNTSACHFKPPQYKTCAGYTSNTPIEESSKEWQIAQPNQGNKDLISSDTCTQLVLGANGKYTCMHPKCPTDGNFISGNPYETKVMDYNLFFNDDYKSIGDAKSNAYCNSEANPKCIGFCKAISSTDNNCMLLSERNTPPIKFSYSDAAGNTCKINISYKHPVCQFLINNFDKITPPDGCDPTRRRPTASRIYNQKGKYTCNSRFSLKKYSEADTSAISINNCFGTIDEDQKDVNLWSTPSEIDPTPYEVTMKHSCQAFVPSIVTQIDNSNYDASVDTVGEDIEGVFQVNCLYYYTEKSEDGLSIAERCSFYKNKNIYPSNKSRI